MSVKHPDDLDRLIGQNIRAHRLSSGLTQTELGRAIGISFQQVQKYEDGRNRISASRLYHVAEALGVPLATFFINRASDRIHCLESPPENSF